MCPSRSWIASKRINISSKKISPTGSQSCKTHGTTPDTKQLYLDSVTFTPETVCSTIKKLKPTTSLGPDNIPNIFLKKCANALSVPLAYIFDTSFKNNTLPYCWKTANVQPVFKKVCTKDASNYRPISLTSTCCRAMERIVNNHLLIC